MKKINNVPYSKYKYTQNEKDTINTSFYLKLQTTFKIIKNLIYKKERKKLFLQHEAHQNMSLRTMECKL